MPATLLSRPQTFRKMAVMPDLVRAGVAVKGKAAAYALVWEWGSLRITPGPKTQFGSNPDGSIGTIFTKYAPSGYIRIHKQQFYDMARQVIQALPSANLIQRSSLVDVLRLSLMKAATEAAQLMQQDAPIDSGLLKASIYAIADAEVDFLLDKSFRPLLIGGDSL